MALGKVGIVACMRPHSGGAELRIFFQPFPSVFPDRFQHQQPGFSRILLGLADQALIYQGSQSLEYVIPQLNPGSDPLSHGFDRSECAAQEYREQLEQALLFSVEQRVAPIDGVAQRLLPHGQVARSTPQHFQPASQPVEQSLG